MFTFMEEPGFLKEPGHFHEGFFIEISSGRVYRMRGHISVHAICLCVLGN